MLEYLFFRSSLSVSCFSLTVLLSGAQLCGTPGGRRHLVHVALPVGWGVGASVGRRTNEEWRTDRCQRDGTPPQMTPREIKKLSHASSFTRGLSGLAVPKRFQR